MKLQILGCFKAIKPQYGNISVVKNYEFTKVVGIWKVKTEIAYQPWLLYPMVTIAAKYTYKY